MTNNSSWKLEICPLDVGNGDSTLILFFKNFVVKKSILIDGGYSYNLNTIKNALDQRLPHQISLDAVIITHWDCDHWKGIQSLAKNGARIQKNTIFFCQAEKFAVNEGAKKFFSELKESHQIKTETNILNKSIWHFLGEEHQGSPDLRFIAINGYVLESKKELKTSSPKLIPKMNGPTETNQGSLSCLITFQDFNYLTSGDICIDQEKAIIKYLQDQEIKLDGMKVSHHGSKYSSPSELFNNLNSRFCVISHGHEDHPHPTVLEKIQKSKIQMCYLTNDYKPQNFFKIVHEGGQNFTQDLNRNYSELIKRAKEFIESLWEINSCVEDLQKYDQTDMDFHSIEDPILYHVRCEVQKELDDIRLVKLIGQLEKINDFAETFEDYTAAFQRSKEMEKELKGNEDLFIAIYKIKALVYRFEETRKKTVKRLDSLLEKIEDCLFFISNQLDFAYAYLQSEKEIKEHEENFEESKSENFNEEEEEEEKVKRVILRPLKESLRKFYSKKEYRKLVQDLRALIIDSQSYWSSSSIKKLHVAGSPNTRTQNDKIRTVLGNFCIEVGQFTELQTGTFVGFWVEKNGEIRGISDCFLTKSKLKNWKPFQKIIQKIKNDFPGSPSNFKYLLEEQTIEEYSDIFRSGLLKGIQPEEKFIVTFKRCKSEDNQEILSVKLKSHSKFLKLKYFTSKYPLNQDSWVVQREVFLQKMLS